MASHGYPRLTDDLDLLVRPTVDTGARVPADFHGLRIFVIGRDALIQNKLATGRPQDLADVDRLSPAPT